jgi:putative transposase
MRFHGKDLRKGRISESNRIYHITTTTYQRKPLFTQLSAARVVINALKTEAENEQADTLAFVLMPDHLHWLLQLQRGSLSGVVGRMKSVTAHRLGGKAWQAGMH